MKSVVKISSLAVVLILAGNKAGQSCSTSCQSAAALPKVQPVAASAASVQHAEKISLISIVYSPGINF